MQEGIAPLTELYLKIPSYGSLI